MSGWTEKMRDAAIAAVWNAARQGMLIGGKTTNRLYGDTSPFPGDGFKGCAGGWIGLELRSFVQEDWKRINPQSVFVAVGLPTGTWRRVTHANDVVFAWTPPFFSSRFRQRLVAKRIERVLRSVPIEEPQAAA